MTKVIIFAFHIESFRKDRKLNSHPAEISCEASPVCTETREHIWGELTTTSSRKKHRKPASSCEQDPSRRGKEKHLNNRRSITRHYRKFNRTDVMNCFPVNFIRNLRKESYPTRNTNIHNKGERHKLLWNKWRERQCFPYQNCQSCCTTLYHLLSLCVCPDRIQGSNVCTAQSRPQVCKLSQPNKVPGKKGYGNTVCLILCSL